MWTLSNIRTFFQQVFETYRHKNCFQHAAALAFDTALSLIPLLILTSWGLWHIDTLQPYVNQVQQFFIAHLLNRPDHLTQDIIHSFLKKSTQLPRFELCIVLVVVWLLWKNIETVFNHLFNIKKIHLSGLRASIGLLILMILPIILGVGFALSTTLDVHLFDHAHTHLLLPWLIKGINMSIGILLFFILFKWIPNCNVPIIAAFVGSLMTWVMLEIAKLSLTWYLAHQSLYHYIYGPFAAIPIFLLWLYIAWLIILLGAAITQVVRLQVR